MYSILEAKNAIKDAVKAYLVKNGKGGYVMNEVNRLPLYLEGKPGIGKTQVVSQIAEEMGIGFVNFSLTHHSRNTVLGLPVIEEVNNVKHTEYTMSEIIAKVQEEYEKGQKEGILLLDEFNCMSDTILPLMLAFLQTKNIGMHALPEGWVIVLCGNPKEYNKSARTFDAAILDRIRKIEIEFNVKDFMEYAASTGFEYEIQEFIKLNPQAAYVCSKEGKNEELVTARAWENLDIALKTYKMIGAEADVGMIRQFLKSERISKEFARFRMLNRDSKFSSKDCENIIKGIQLDEYSQKLAAAEKTMRSDMAGQLMSILENRVKERSISMKAASEAVDHIIAVNSAKDSVTLALIYRRINENQELLIALSKYRSDHYIVLCKQACCWTKTA